ncbi:MULTISPECIES: branched-chain amino acid ABC transporter permease [Pseudonocardia]|uniref:ABC-type transporter, integral membrane subunit n=1 Tax=Pseudonocardia dioxanivorans (strain ATCC 55486 / DSM 44775 / JCM 13855 / CB1190) TaxID=675635 RepID=F4CN31_PSEUX|nr:ABC-type transporter, integral membrane subunit [Pseudonocardia dioxanivorans CB1190]GJF02609.1 branched-chain amino acid ABC transporter permease [Pseudonocardia sp. D17]
MPVISTIVLAQGPDWIQFDVEAFVSQFWSNTIDGLAYGSIYALVAMGYTMVYGVLQLINFAHSEVFIVGAYAVFFVLSALGFGPSAPNLSVAALVGDLVLAMLVAMLVSGLVAVALERVAYRPLRRRNAPRLAFLITAIGASFAIQYALFAWRGANPEPAVIMFRPKPVFEIFGATIDSQQLVIFGAAIVLMIITDMFVNRTRLGRGLRAVAQDPDTATLMGVNKERVIVLTFLIGGILAGAAALFYVMKVPAGVQFNGGFILGIKAFAAAVLGGIGNIRGALLGGLLLGVIGNYGQTLLGNAQWTDVVAFVVLVGILMIRPTGILGESLGRARV